MGDRDCDLSCREDGVIHEFVGPVKIVLVDPTDKQYNRRKNGAAFIAIANMMIGANTALVALFTLGFKLPVYSNLHIILCTLGYQFCMPCAILMIHPLNGASAPLRKTQRRKEHIFLHLIGLFLGLLGSIFVFKYRVGDGDANELLKQFDSMGSHHKVTGIATAVFALGCILSGALIFSRHAELKRPGLFAFCHRVFGILTFILSTACFVLGIIKPAFQIWLYVIGYMSPTYIMLTFTSFYTLIILITPIIKCLPCKI